MYEYKVEFFPVTCKLNDQISDNYVRTCVFCDKEVEINKENICKIPNNMQNDLFYCSFCYKNNFHQKNNFFIFSLRSIIQNYYEHFYCKSHNRSVWLSQIQEMIELHKEAGLSNYAFDYDDESFNWFLDLSKIEEKDMQEIYKTVVDMLICFNLWYCGIDAAVIYNNLKSALNEAWSEKKFIRCIPVFNSKNSTVKIKSFNNRKMVLRDFE